jgi:hypothetical protein
MKEVLRSNNPVDLSYAQSLMKDAGIDCLVLDSHAAIVEGSIGAIQRRLMVPDDDAEEARRLLRDSDIDG